jgi:hypothetical protein
MIIIRQPPKVKHNEININVLLYYNERDIELNEGFYPCLYLNKVRESKNYVSDCDIYKITVSFDSFKNKDGKYIWIQTSYCSITGFDGDNGKDLLIYLNLYGLRNGLYILNSGGRIIYPPTKNSTFRVLEQVN